MSDEFHPPIGPIDPAHPDCAAVVAEVSMLLDGECSPETREKLQHHLDECPTCLEQHDLEKRVKAVIASKCGGEKAPDRVREMVRLQISRTTIMRY